jgi:hypothetical protein
MITKIFVKIKRKAMYQKNQGVKATIRQIKNQGKISFIFMALFICT